MKKQKVYSARLKDLKSQYESEKARLKKLGLEMSIKDTKDWKEKIEKFIALGPGNIKLESESSQRTSNRKNIEESIMVEDYDQG